MLHKLYEYLYKISSQNSHRNMAAFLVVLATYSRFLLSNFFWLKSTPLRFCSGTNTDQKPNHEEGGRPNNARYSCFHRLAEDRSAAIA